MDQSALKDLQETRSSDDPLLHRVLIVGGGAAGLELATRLGDSFGKCRQASITLLDKSRIHVWKPHFHEVASGTLDVDVDSVEYIAHARRHHYRYRIGAMNGLDRSSRRISVEPTADEDGRQVIPPRVLGYDSLVMAVGSVGNDFGTPGVREHAIAIDSAEEAARFNRRMINACLRANAQYEPLRPGQLHCAIIGGGATGVELAAELHKSMRDLASFGLDHIDFDKLVKLTVVEAGPRILGPLPESIAHATLQMLRRLGINVRVNERVIGLTADGVQLKGGEFLPAELIVWAAGIKAPEFLKNLDGLENDRINRLVVRPTLQTTRDDNIFSIGDCACCVLPGNDAPVPPRAQSAHQMATHMVKSVQARILDKPLAAFKYRDFGSLVNLSKYGTVGNLIDQLTGHSVIIEGAFARLMYRSLYKMHQQALHGFSKMALDSVAKAIGERTEPRIKLH